MSALVVIMARQDSRGSLLGTCRPGRGIDRSVDFRSPAQFAKALVRMRCGAGHNGGGRSGARCLSQFARGRGGVLLQGYAGRIVVERVHTLLAGYARLFRTSPVKGGFAGSNACRLTGRVISGRFLGDCVAVDSKIRQDR